MTLDTTVVARSVVTVVWFITFVGLCLWAWSTRRREDFTAAARLPFDDDAMVEPADAPTKPATGDATRQPTGSP